MKVTFVGCVFEGFWAVYSADIALKSTEFYLENGWYESTAALKVQCADLAISFEMINPHSRDELFQNPLIREIVEKCEESDRKWGKLQKIARAV